MARSTSTLSPIIKISESYSDFLVTLFVIHITREKCQVCLYDGPGFSLLCAPPRLSEKSRREQKSLYPTTGATTDSQSSLRVLLLLRQSPPPQVSARVFSMYSGRISGVCQQWCIQGASRVFAYKGVFGAHLRCLQLTGTVIGPVSA